MKRRLRQRWWKPMSLTCFVSGAVTPVLFVAYFVGSLLFTGGQIVVSGWPLWRAFWSAPVFVVPDWLLIAANVTALLSGLFLLLLANYRDARVFSGMSGSALASVVAVLFFSHSLRQDPGWADGLFPGGLYWVAGAAAIGGVVVSMLGILIFGPKFDSARRAGSVSL